MVCLIHIIWSIKSCFNVFYNIYVNVFCFYVDDKAVCIHGARRNFSLVARYSLNFTHCLLLVVKSLITRCKIRSLLVEKLLVAKNHSLLVEEFARYSLQKLLVAKNHSLLVAEVPRCKKITRHSLWKKLRELMFI